MTTLDPAAASTTAGATPQPGWYPDPQNPGGTIDRWWNGAGWSEHTRSRGSMPPPAGAPVPAASAVRASRILHNGPAWWSLGFGLLSLALAVGVLVSDAHYVWLSTSGVFAVLGGVRALRLRSAGLASAFAAPIIGIVAGAVGSLLMILLLLAPAQSTGYGPADSSYDGSAASSPL
jgi:Protein of unknown function (DUF2510)